MLGIRSSEGSHMVDVFIESAIGIRCVAEGAGSNLSWIPAKFRRRSTLELVKIERI